jgi:MOSC domain-containing protein YiiM
MSAPAASAARVLSVNVGRPREVQWQGRTVTTAIWKAPHDGPLAVDTINIDGDDQADRRVHGGVDKAVYAYATEDYAWWTTALGTAEPLGPGRFGENLTTAGLDLRESRIGDRWRVGTVLLEVAQPRTPCFKLGIRMGDDEFPGKFTAAGRPGAYLRVLEPGTLNAGDLITVTPADPSSVTLAAVADDDADDGVLAFLANDPRVPEVWRRVARHRLGL